MGVLERIVAVGRDHQGRDGFGPTDEEGEDVEGRFIGPVEVLQHQDRRRCRTEIAGHGQGHVGRASALCQGRPELAPGTLGDGEQWPEGTGRKERVAGTPQHRLRPGYFVTKRTQEGSFAHSRFTADHYHGAPPAASHVGQRLFEHGQLARSLKQFVRPVRCGSDYAGSGHAQWCTLLAAVSMLTRILPTVQELHHHGETAAQWLKMLSRGEARPKRPVPKWGNPCAQSR